MADPFLLGGIVAMMVGVVISRGITQKVYCSLDEATWLRLLDAFAHLRVWNSLPFFAVFAAVILFRGAFVSHPMWAWRVFALMLLGCLGALRALSLRKLRRLNVPRSYVTAYGRAKIVGYVSLLCLWGAILVPRLH